MLRKAQQQTCYRTHEPFVVAEQSVAAWSSPGARQVHGSSGQQQHARGHAPVPSTAPSTLF